MISLPCSVTWAAYNSGWFWVWHVVKGGLQLLILLPLAPKLWHCMSVTPCLLHADFSCWFDVDQCRELGRFTNTTDIWIHFIDRDSAHVSLYLLFSGCPQVQLTFRNNLNWFVVVASRLKAQPRSLWGIVRGRTSPALQEHCQPRKC